MRKIRLVDEDGNVISEWDDGDVGSMLDDYYSTIPHFTYDALQKWMEM